MKKQKQYTKARASKVKVQIKNLMDVINFTQKVSTKIHGILDRDKILKTLAKEFKASKKYTASILLLTQGNSKLKIIKTSLSSKILEKGEAISHLKIKNYQIDLQKSSIYRQVVKQGKTKIVNVKDIIKELLPTPLAFLICKALGYEKNLCIITPLKRQGEIIGALAVSSPELAKEFIPSVKSLAQHISNALELARERAERKKAEQALGQGERKYRTVFELSPEAIVIIDRKGIVIDINARVYDWLGYRPDEIIGKGLISAPYFNKQARAKVKQWLLQRTKQRKTSFYEMDFISKKGKIMIGRIAVSSIRGRNMEIIGSLVMVSDATKQKKMEAEIMYKSSHDQITDLYNRSFFEQELKRLDARENLPLSVAIGDLNGLKLVNDAFGHSKGDELLRRIARTLKKVCRKQDLLARWGGDEFIMLLPNTSEEEAKRICHNVQKKCKRALKTPIPLSISLGIAGKTRQEQDIQAVILKAENRMYENKFLAGKTVHYAIISSLQKILAQKSHETKEHNQRLQKLAGQLGEYIGLPKDQIELLDFLAGLHDIGKVAIPVKVLKKSGPLSKKELEIMKKHSEIGHRIARSSPELAPIANLIWSHHEWWDGTGYPRGLKASEIPFLARIISIIDAYDVMTKAKRPYRENISQRAALRELRRRAGAQFDPALVKSFVQMMSAQK